MDDLAVSSTTNCIKVAHFQYYRRYSLISPKYKALVSPLHSSFNLFYSTKSTTAPCSSTYQKLPESTQDIMATHRDHLLANPKFLLAFRILQLVTAVAILGLAAYGITFLSFDGVDLTMFTV